MVWAWDLTIELLFVRLALKWRETNGDPRLQQVRRRSERGRDCTGSLPTTQVSLNNSGQMNSSMEIQVMGSQALWIHERRTRLNVRDRTQPALINENNRDKESSIEWTVHRMTKRPLRRLPFHQNDAWRVLQ